MKAISGSYKISILTTSDFPFGGAAENFVRQMALGLFENNADIEVIRFWGDRYLNKNDTPIKCSNYLFKRPFENNFLKFLELFCQILYAPFFIFNRKFLNNDNAVILYGLDRVYIVAPLLFFAKILSLKCFRVITEVYLPTTYATSWWRKPLVFFNKAQLKYFDRYLDGIIVLSKYLYQLCISNQVNKQNIIIIPHFINVGGGDTNLSSSDKNDFIITYCGTCTMENGVTDLIQAYIYLRHRNLLINSKLKIVGPIHDSVKKFVEQIERFDKDTIQLMGALSLEGVAQELHDSSVLVNPRRSTILADSGFPTKLGEYFSTKLPVVTTKVGDMKGYFEDKQEVVFASPNDYISLAESIKFVFDNRDSSNAIGLRGYEWAKKNLDYKKNALALLIFAFQRDR